MSMIQTYYSIVGYDLTDHETEKLKDWIWGAEGESYLQNQEIGEIQLFNDPADGTHLYLGYILSCNDEYFSNDCAYDINELVDKEALVRQHLDKLKQNGVIESFFEPKFKLIMFSECL